MEANNINKEKKNKTRAYSITTVYGLLVIIFLILFGFRAPFPPFEEEGVLINFGNVVSAGGNEEPNQAAQVNEVTPPPIEEEVVEETEEVVTQEMEETVSVPKPEKEPKKPEPKPESEKTKPKVETKPVEPEKPKEEPKPVEEKPDLIEGTLYPGSSSGGSSEGTSSGSGNMGETDGVDDGPSYQGENSGSGKSGVDGFSLTGRNMVTTPTVEYKSQKEGKVNLKIKVDKNGKVIKAEFTLAGSTTSDSYLVQRAIEAALNARFNSDDKAPEIQQGILTFIFKLK